MSPATSASHAKPKVGDYPCYSDDWTRTDPDLVLYLPAEPTFAHEASDHVLVEVTPGRIRLRKAHLKENDRKRAVRRAAATA